ncbi:MAG: hypothetical protein ASARMPREDX12_005259 [Alectoria sarmentosa]|nr:MAG: hypothetical protein ASARMPREDX12_005259 [Alectoria sarmentosa]
MSFWDAFSTEGDHFACTEMQGAGPAAMTRFSYPDPARYCTQDYLSQQMSFPETFDTNNCYYQPSGSHADTILPEDDLTPDFMLPSRPTSPPASGQGSICHSQYEATWQATSLETCYQAPPLATSIIDDSNTLEGAQSHSRRGMTKNSSDSTGNETKRQRGSKKRTPQSQPLERKRLRPIRKKATPADTAHRPGPREPASAASVPAAGKGGKLSKLGQKKLELGEKMGTDYREKAEIRVVDGVKFGLVDKEWKAAGHHRDFRETFIVLAAQQPGAPVWRKEMGLNYTSYSPLTQGWIDASDAVRDSKGRQVLSMPARPADLKHNPKCDYLIFEGLVMLDQNNRPIKDYPGVPLTLSKDISDTLIAALRKCLGMTVSDLKARMILEKNTPGGGILTGSCFTNRVGRKKNITPWHKRRTAKGTKKDTTAPSSLPIEVTKSSEPIPTLTSTPHMSQDDSTSDYLSPFSPPTPRTSLPTAYSTGFIQPGPNTSFLEEDFVWDPIWDVDQPSPCTESGAFSGANWDLSKPVASGFHGQLGSEPTPGDNQYSAPPFRCANMPAQTANNAAPEGIYSPGYPFRYAPQNIYAANSPAFAAETHKYIIHPRTRAPPTGDDFWLEEF